MNVFEINVFQILSFMYKCKNSVVPQCFTRLYNIKTYSNYRTRSYGKLVEPFCKVKLTEYSISFRGPKLWNELIASKLPNIHTISLTAFISMLNNVLDYF